METIGQEPKKVVMYLPNCKIEGEVSLMKGAHLSDFVTLGARKFITVSKATVSAIRAHETWKYKVDEMNINKDYILNIFAREGMKPADK
jgi:hypothetical protein